MRLSALIVVRSVRRIFFVLALLSVCAAPGSHGSSRARAVPATPTPRGIAAPGLPAPEGVASDGAATGGVASSGLPWPGPLITGPVPPQFDPDSSSCGGVVKTPDSSLTSEGLHSPDDWIGDLGYLVLRMRDVYPQDEFEYVRDLLETILPSMVEVLGPPVTLDTLIVELNATGLQYYNCYDNKIVMDGMKPFQEAGTSPSWDNLFIHELTHAFDDDLVCDGDFPSWLTEGIADAVRYFVAELVTNRTGRNVRGRNFAERMAVYDMYDNAGEQVLGGCGMIAYRMDLDFLYQNAAGAVLVPALAQIAAGLDEPHPLRRLNEALREEMHGPSPHRMYEAIDRAWSAPVDGQSPPSRWIRRRSVTCPSVRDGEFVALVPMFRHNAVNPPWLRVLQFTRHWGSYVMNTMPHVMRYTGSDGTLRVAEGQWIKTPDLPLGAYRVDVEVIGSELTARSWIIIVDPGLVKLPIWEGVAVVLVDREGLPVDVPRSELTVNGRILARVPGAVFVAPYQSSLGGVTLERNGQVFGTVTATGNLPRMVVMCVTAGQTDGETDAHRPPVASWTPYHPVRGGTMDVTIHASRTSLSPGATSIDAVLCNSMGEERARVVMSAGEGDAFSATLLVPSDLADAMLSFEDSLSTHESCGDWRFGWFSGYQFMTSSPGAADLVDVMFDGSHLVVRFDAPVDPARLGLYVAPDATGPWAAVQSSPTHIDSLLFMWTFDPLTEKGTYVRGVLRGSDGTDDRILFTEFVETAPTRPKLVASPPFPNPAAAVVQWPFEVTAPTNASLQVYDVAGRRVFDSGTMALYPGTEVFRWNSTSGPRRTPPGVYFLRVRAAGDAFTRKVVILR